MKFKRQLVAVGSAAALVAAGASVALIGGASGSSAAEVPSSAYGIQATGLLALGPLPSVTSNDGKLVTDSLIGLPDNPLLNGGVVNVQAENDAAESDVTNLKLSGSVLDQLTGALAPLTSQLGPVCDALGQVDLSAVTGTITDATGTLDLGALTDVLNQVGGATGIDLSAVSALDLSQLLPTQLSGICDALAGNAGLLNVGAVTTECHGKTGSVSIADLTALGLPLNIDTSKANSSISVPGVLTVTVNKQTTNPDGTFTVEGLEVNVLDQLKLVVTSATCGHISSRPTPPPTEPTSDAPTPVPFHTHAPVTG